LQALGADHHITPDIFTWELRPGDKFLICSDGLWQAFPDTNELAQRLDSTMPPAELCQQLVAEANRRDGSDNISVVIIEVNEVPSWRSRIARSVTARVREAVSLVI
jgi:protein phosphatase